MSGAKGGTEAKRWTLDDQIAFECALAQDEKEDWDTLQRRDAALSIPEPLWQEPDRRRIAALWMRERLADSPAAAQAAETIGQSVRVAGQLLGVFGFVAGLGLASAALAYTGEAPINVSAFFFVFVLLQALLAFALFIPYLLPRPLKERLVAGPLFRFSRLAFAFAFAKTQALANRFLDGRRRQEAAAIAAASRIQFARQKAVISWLAISKAQATALCFNLGALFALLIAVIFSDRAFGWQTTLSVSAASIHDLAQWVALPWSWCFGEGVGYPAIAQIEGSRIALKEGIRSLATENLTVWWRFLALGMVTYGIVPRLFFWTLATVQLRAALNRYSFRDAAAQRLFDRLAPRRDRFAAESTAVAEGSLSERWRGPTAEAETQNQRIHCLITPSIASGHDQVSLGAALAERWGVSAASIALHAWDGLARAQELAIDEASQVAIVYESWMPPIKETERQLRKLRAALDSRTLVRIVLLGVPDANSGPISLRPASAYLETWDAFARRMGDPYLILDRSAA